MSSILGLHVLPNADLDDALQYITGALKPQLVVVLDNLAFARKLRTHDVYQVPFVVHRTYNPADHRFHETMSPEAWVAAHHMHGADGVIVACLNEPDGQANLMRLAGWCADVMRIAHDAGLRLALPNFSMGNPNEARVAAGELDALIEAFRRFPEHCLAVHEYANDNPAAEQKWHIRRYTFLWDRFRKLGAPIPQTLVTETGRDKGGGRDDGWRAYFNNDELRYVRFLTPLADDYRADKVPAAIYGWGPGFGWEAFNTANAPKVREALPTIGRIDEEMPQMPEYTFPGDDAPWQRGIFSSTSAGGTNIRSQPSTSGAKVGSLKLLAPGAWTSTMISDGSGTWYALKLDDGVQGYVRSDVVIFEAEPAPEPDIPDALYSIFLSEDEVAQVAALHDQLAAAMRRALDEGVQIAETHEQIAAIYRAAAVRAQTVEYAPLL